MILVIYLLSFQLPALSRLEIIYFTLLACIAITAHISHLPQAFPLVSVVLVLIRGGSYQYSRLWQFFSTILLFTIFSHYFQRDRAFFLLT